MSRQSRPSDRHADVAAQDRDWPIVDWRKWGFGFSLEFRDPAFLRLWIGPVRIGWKYGRNV